MWLGYDKDREQSSLLMQNPFISYSASLPGF